jgi:hypothetical protein
VQRAQEAGICLVGIDGAACIDGEEMLYMVQTTARDDDECCIGP